MSELYRRKVSGRRRFGRGKVFALNNTGFAPLNAFQRMAGRVNYSQRRATTRGMINAGLASIEHKFLDCPLSSTAMVAPADAAGAELPPTSGSTGCYTAPAQGDGPSNRDGNRIVVTELNVRGQVSVAAQSAQATADLACIVTIAMVQDTQSNLAQLNSEDVFANPAAVSYLAADVYRNMSYTKRFRVLKMKTFRLPFPTLTGAATVIEQSGFHIPFQLKWKGKMPVTFTTGGTAANINTVTDNSIQMIAYCSSISLNPAIQWNARMRFYG